MTNNFPESVDQTAYQVFLCTCRAHLPFSFAVHPWFVINKQGKLSRWEVRYYENTHNPDWGHIHKNALEPFSGIQVIASLDVAFWSAHVESVLTGEEAKELIQVIEGTPETYPYGDTYRLTGPNSNTYAQWVIDQCPDLSTELPWNAVGKRY